MIIGAHVRVTIAEGAKEWRNTFGKDFSESA